MQMPSTVILLDGPSTSHHILKTDVQEHTAMQWMTVLAYTPVLKIITRLLLVESFFIALEACLNSSHLCKDARFCILSEILLI